MCSHDDVPSQTPWDTIEPVSADPLPGAVESSIEIEQAPCAPQRAERSGAWTIPLLCAGIALIACCMLIPAADENRRLVYERATLKADLEQLEKQVATNDEFLKRVGNDPALAERLAQRQMKMVREGSSVMELKGHEARGNESPFLLVAVPPPGELPPYRCVGGRFAEFCRRPKTQLYLMGAGLLMMAAGLVLGHGKD